MYEVGKKYKPRGIGNQIIEILFSDSKTVVFDNLGLYHQGERVHCSPLDLNLISGWEWEEYHEPKKYWVNVYEGSHGHRYMGSTMYSCKDDAEDCGKRSVVNCIKTVEIEV